MLNAPLPAATSLPYTAETAHDVPVPEVLAQLVLGAREGFCAMSVVTWG